MRDSTENTSTSHQEASVRPSESVAGARRQLLKMAGAGLAAVPFVGAMAATTGNAGTSAIGPGPYRTRAWGSSTTAGRFSPITIERRAPGPKDVVIDILYSGICHSDIHMVRGDWGKPHSPCVPGHEIVGKVVAVGEAVRKFRVGDIAGVGCMVDSCGTCEHCQADLEQYCSNGPTFTYESPDKVSGGTTYGGYSERIVVTEHFAIRIPPGMNLAATAPLLCAGVTTFSPMQHWRLGEGQRVGIIGMGGLGHVALKLAVARKAKVTVFTTSPGKVADAHRLGAENVIVSTDEAAMKNVDGSFDLLISTVPEIYSMAPFLALLKLDGTLVNIGVLGSLKDADLQGLTLISGRKSLAGSMIGGIAETQEVIDYCAARNIGAEVEVISPDQISSACDRVVNKEVRYRYVIDFTSNKRA